MSTYGECTICMEEIVSLNDDLNVLITCGHTYHRACVDEWIKMRAHCPQCRVACTVADIKHLYFNSVDKSTVPTSPGIADRGRLVAEIAQLRQEADGRRVRITDLEMTVHETEELQEITRGEIEEANGKLLKRAQDLDEAAIAAVEQSRTIDRLTADVAKSKEQLAASLGANRRIGNELKGLKTELSLIRVNRNSQKMTANKMDDVFRAADNHKLARGQNAEATRIKELLAALREVSFRRDEQKELTGPEVGGSAVQASRGRLLDVGNTTESKSTSSRLATFDEPSVKSTVCVPPSLCTSPSSQKSTPTVRALPPLCARLRDAHDK